MIQRLVMLDANLIISAFDDGANCDSDVRLQAKELVAKLSSDPVVKFVTTPLIRYEVLCKPSSPESQKKLEQIIALYKMYEIQEIVADRAIEIYRAARKKVQPNDLKKHKFDVFHIAVASVNNVGLETLDKQIQTTIKSLEAE